MLAHGPRLTLSRERVTLYMGAARGAPLPRCPLTLASSPRAHQCSAGLNRRHLPHVVPINAPHTK